MDIEHLFKVTEKEKSFIKKIGRVAICLGALQTLNGIVFCYWAAILEKPLTLSDPIYPLLLVTEILVLVAIALSALKTWPIQRKMGLSKKASVEYKNRLKTMGGCVDSNKRNILYKTLAQDYPDLFSATKKVWELDKASS